MRVGDIIHIPCIIDGTSYGRMPATVQYIHPRGRFCVVQFTFEFGSFRETVYLGNRAKPQADAPRERKKEKA